MFFEYNFSDLRYTHTLTKSQVRADSRKLDLYKMVYLSGGEATVASPGQQVACTAGDLVFLGHNQDFTLKPYGDAPADFYVVYFTEFLFPTDIANVIRYCEGGFHVADSPIPQLFARFDWHLANIPVDNTTEVKMLFRCVLTEILVYFVKIATRQTAIPGMLNENIEPVLDFIARNLERPLQIRDICTEFHYSRSHLCKSFTQITGVPLMQYIRTARAEYAEKLLKSGLPATEVARQLGYTDYSSFYRMYRRYASCAPSETGPDEE